MRPRQAFAQHFGARMGHGRAADLWDAACAGDADAQARVSAWLAIDGWPPGTPTSPRGALGRPSALAPIARALALLAERSVGFTGAVPAQIRDARYGDLSVVGAAPLVIDWALRRAGGYHARVLRLDGARADAILAAIRNGRAAPPTATDPIVRGGAEGQACALLRLRRVIARGRSILDEERRLDAARVSIATSGNGGALVAVGDA